jgi:CheY-like chemotaxis protein
MNFNYNLGMEINIDKNKKTILIVEDEVSLQEAIKLKLRKDKSVNIIAATSGEEALALVKDKKPDLVWLDLLMPKMGGLEFLELIRKDEVLKDLRVVVVSASGGADKIQKAKELGAIDYIVKGSGTLEAMIKKVKDYLD